MTGAAVLDLTARGGRNEAATLAAAVAATVAEARYDAQSWREQVVSVFGDLDLKLGDTTRFAGSIRHARLGELELADVTTSFEDGARHRSHVAGDSRESHVIVMPLSGLIRITQATKECEIGPGQFALFALNAPHRYHHEGPVRALSIKAPCHLLRSRLGSVDDLLATRFDADQGLGRVTFDLAASVLRERAQLTGQAAACLATALAEMAAAMLGGSRPELSTGPPASRQLLYERCVRLIDLQLGDPNLGAEWLALRCGISVRYLHKVFQDTDVTLGEFIRNRRLESCRDRLLAQRGDLQIKEVALSAGFRSVAHFCNAFKARFGASAGEVRRASAAT